MANVIEFTIRGVDAASGAFKSFSKSAVTAVKKVATAAYEMGKRFALAFSGAALAAFALTKRIASLQDRVGKIALRLGITTEALSEFHHAAELGGISTEQFDMALQRMTRRVAEAGQGMGEAKGAIQELGLNARELAALPIDEQMNRVADALNNVRGQSEKVRLAFKLFDSEGVGVLQTMQDGSASFREAADELAYFGAVVTGQGAANSAEFNDALTRLKTSFTGLGIALGEKFIPIFTGVINMFANFVADNRARFTTFIKGLVTGFIQFGIIVGQVVDKISVTFSNIFDLSTMADTLNSIVNGFVQMGSSIVKLMLEIAPRLARILITAFRAGWEAFKELAKGALDHVFDFLTGNDIARSFGEIVADAVRNAQAELGEMPSLLAETGEIIVDAARATSSSLADIFGINTELALEQAEAMLEGLAEFGTVIEETAVTNQERVMTFMELMREHMATFLADQGTMVEQFALAMFKVMQSTTEAIGKGVADIIVDGKKATEVFKNILKTVVKQIIASYVTLFVQRVISATQAVPATGANAMETMSAAPFPINLTAPAVAAAFSAQAAGYAASVKAAAHGGLENVPSEGTYLLDAGERVLSPRQNRDLTNFLGQGQEGGAMNVEVNIYTSARNFDDIDEDDLEEFVAGPLMRMIDKLDDRGVRQKALERKFA